MGTIKKGLSQTKVISLPSHKMNVVFILDKDNVHIVRADTDEDVEKIKKKLFDSKKIKVLKVQLYNSINNILIKETIY